MGLYNNMKHNLLMLTEMQLCFQIRVGKQKSGGHNLPPSWNRVN
jgi:hypothetical protein